MDDQIPWGWRKIPLLLHTFSLFWIADRLTATLNKQMSRSRLSRDTGRTWRVTSLLLCQAVIGCQVREVRCSKMHLQPLRNRFTSKCNQCRCCKVKKKSCFAHRDANDLMLHFGGLCLSVKLLNKTISLQPFCACMSALCFHDG